MSDIRTLTIARREDFVGVFPPELSNKLFSYLPDIDIFSCAQCSLGWRRVINNNSQWIKRCKRQGWLSLTTNPLKLAVTESHMGDENTYNFRRSPKFSLPSVDSVRLSSLCTYALHFRYCKHLTRNWTNGIYVINRLHIPEENIPTIVNCTCCNEEIIVVATTLGFILIWSISGVPKFLQSIKPPRSQVEVELVQLQSKFLVALYQNGLIRVLNASSEILNQVEPFNVMFQLRVNCKRNASADQLFDLFEDVLFPEAIIDIEEGYFAADMMIFTTEDQIILTGLACTNFMIWNIRTGALMYKINLPLFHVSFKSFLSPLNLFISAKKFEDHRVSGLDSSFCLLVYPLKDLTRESSEIDVHNLVEEVKTAEMDEKIVYVTQDGTITSFLLSSKELIFKKQTSTYVDNLIIVKAIHCSLLYHRYHGYIVALNWSGEVIYEIEAHIGIIRGLLCVNQFLVSGGDVKQLSIWDVETGRKLHTVFHQPCSIQYLHADETKIVTVGKVDPPVVIGYW